MDNQPAFAPARHENLPALRLAGLKRRYSFDQMGEIPALWMEFVGLVKDKAEGVNYGVVWNSDASGLDYAPAYELAEGEELPEGLTLLEFPAQRYAVFPHEETTHTLSHTIDQAFRTWLPGSGEQPTLTPEFFERYGLGFDPATMSGDLSVWIPVK